jgi:hypothetical protein
MYKIKELYFQFKKIHVNNIIKKFIHAVLLKFYKEELFNNKIRLIKELMLNMMK